MNKENKLNKKRFLVPIIVILISLLLEVVVFNCRFWQSMFYEEMHISDLAYSYGGVVDYGDGYYSVEEEIMQVYIEGIGTKVHNIYLDITTPSSIELVFAETGTILVDLYACDEASAMGYEIYSKKMHTLVDATKYLWPDLYGEAEVLYLEITPGGTGTILVNDIVINAKVPFAFEFSRFFGILVVVTFLALLRKDSFFWKEDCIALTPKKKVTFATLLVIFCMGIWLVASGKSDMVAMYGLDFNPYQELAEALYAGQVSLLNEPSAALQAMENPYDYLLREEQSVEYMWDTAYYDGNYYVYFGVLPCLLFYLPFYAMTGLHLPDILVILFMSILFAVGCCVLIRELIKRFYPSLPFGLWVIMTIAMTLGCQIPFFVVQPDPYNIPILAAMMFSVWGIWFWMTSDKREQRGLCYGRVFTGSLCMAAVLGCRPQMILFSFLAFVLFGSYLKTDDGFDKKQRLNCLLTALVPYFLLGIPIALYNYLRFDSFFEFGAKYNLTIFNMTVTDFSLGKLIQGLYENWFRLPSLHASFPFVELLKHDNDYWCRGYIFTEDMYGGLFCCNLFLFALFLLPSLRKTGLKKENAFFAGVLMMISFTILCLDVKLAGISYRYLGDYSFALFLASFVVIGFLWKELQGAKYEWMMKKGILLSFVLSIFFNLMIFFAISYKYPLNVGNTALYYEIMSLMNVW